MLRVSATPCPARTLTGLGLLTAVLTLTGCGGPPGVDTPSQPPAGPVTPTGTPTRPAPTVTGPGFTPGPVGSIATTGRTAVACAGHPGAAQIVALLHRSPGLLPAGIRATVTTGPLCADDWQFSVVQVPDRDPLQVVTQGPAATLTLVTAGTDVCSIPVRGGAPAAIRALACDGGDSLPTPG